MHIVKTHYHTIILMLMLVISIAFYSYLPLNSPSKFTSPDETANYYFTKLYSETGKLSYNEPLYSITDGFARPRSSGAKDGFVGPAGFPGFFIIGGYLQAIDINLVNVMIPLIASIGIIFMYILTKTLFGKKAALLSSFLLFLMPPYFYWGSMHMFNNIGAATLLLMSITLLILSLKKKVGIYLIPSALCLSISQLYRFSDATYNMIILIFIVRMKDLLNLKYFIPASIAYLVTIITVFIYNKVLWGSFLAFGYSPTPSDVSLQISAAENLLSKVKTFILPSGVKLDLVTKNIFEYFINLIPISFILSILGISGTMKSQDKFVKEYTIFYILLSIWIAVYYGSSIYWGYDIFTMDASYIRYFLPIYIFSVPLAAKFLITISKKTSVAIVSVFVVTSLLLIINSRSGILEMRSRRINTQIGANIILSKTNSNSVIFTTGIDKLLFPERKVIIYGPGYKDPITNETFFKYEKFIEMITNLKKDNKSVYISNDRADTDIEHTKELLRQNHYSLIQVGNDLYEVTKI